MFEIANGRIVSKLLAPGIFLVGEFVGSSMVGCNDNNSNDTSSAGIETIPSPLAVATADFVESVRDEYAAETQLSGERYSPFWEWALSDVEKPERLNDKTRALAYEWSVANQAVANSVVDDSRFHDDVSYGSLLMLKLLLDGLVNGNSYEILGVSRGDGAKAINTIIESHTRPSSLARWSNIARVLADHACGTPENLQNEKPASGQVQGSYVTESGSINIKQLDFLFAGSIKELLLGTANSWAQGEGTVLKIQGEASSIKADGEWLGDQVLAAKFGTIVECQQSILDIARASQSRNLRNSIRHLNITQEHLLRMLNCYE